jgi:Flp pilus assembly protein TadG
MPTRRPCHDRRRGGAAVEFAVSFPFLLLLCIGVGDFGRMLLHAITVAHAANAGSAFGAISNVNAVRYSDRQSLATDDAENIDHVNVVTAVADSYCDCPAAPARSPTDPNAVSCASTCAGYGTPRLYVRTRASQSFAGVAPIPGIPESVAINRMVYMRVQ